jgi:hypothetical protein
LKSGRVRRLREIDACRSHIGQVGPLQSGLLEIAAVERDKSTSANVAYKKQL